MVVLIIYLIFGAFKNSVLATDTYYNKPLVETQKKPLNLKDFSSGSALIGIEPIVITEAEVIDTETEEDIIVEEETIALSEEVYNEPQIDNDISQILYSSVYDYLLNTLEQGIMSDDFLILCSIIHLEAGTSASIESKCAVGNVVINRLLDQETWGCNTISEVAFREKQFSVVRSNAFNICKDSFASGVWDDEMQNTINAAILSLSRSTQYDIPDDVQYFYGDESKRTWGNHEYCFSLGGNSYFK